MQAYFDQLDRVRYEGSKSSNPLAFRHYNPDELVLGKRMEEHLRFAACYWHTFCWNGADMFGVGAFNRPWQQPGEALALAKRKADVAFEFFHKLHVPFYCFHDVDVSPEGASLKEYINNFAQMVDVLAGKQEESGVKLLWGTANCFTNPRYGAGAATNPDPEVFSWAATQVVTAMEATHKLGGENYVLWGGREGYETLLNTDLRQEREQLGRFMQMVVEHKHKIGFQGTLLIEPKPQEPTKHQYDYDAATVCISALSLRRKPSLSASSMATSSTSGRSSPSRSRFMPTSTSNSPFLKSPTMSILSKVSMSECIYRTFMPTSLR